jgi:glyoxylase-like metal-dependent hydrolase (beta-lactamase superfamily II)
MKSLPITIALFSVTMAVGQPKPVAEIAPDVFFYFGDEFSHRSANCVWVVLEDYVVVVDANYPWAASEILEEIRKTTDKPVRFVVNTHYHHDHTFENGIFQDAGAAIVSSTAASREMNTLGRREWEQNYSGQPLDAYKQIFPSVTFDDSLAFEDGVHPVELIHMGPAHTAGDVVIWLPKERVLVTGDLFVNGNPWGNNVADPDANYDRWLTVLDTVASWNPAIVVPGHGEPATTQNLKWQRDYLADMLQQVRVGIGNGLTKEELVKSVDLDHHPVYGKNKVSTARSVGAMYDKLKK